MPQTVTLHITATQGELLIRAAEAMARIAAGYMLDGAEVLMSFGADEETEPE